MKRFLAVLLCLVMLFSLAPLSVFAADESLEGSEPGTEETAEFSVEEAYEAYSALETEEEKEAYLATLTEEQQAALLEYIDSLFDVEKAYEEYSALETEETKEAYLAELTEEQQAELNEYIEGLFDIEKAYEEYSALETEEAKKAYLAELTEGHRKELTDYIDGLTIDAEIDELKPILSLTESNTIDTFDDLSSAISSSGTITIGADFAITGTLTINSGVSIVLDLGGKTLTFAGSSDVERAFEVKGSLTISNGTLIDNTTSVNKYGSLIRANGGTVIINSGTFTRGEGCTNYSLIQAYNSAKSIITINGGTFNGSNSKFIGTKSNKGIFSKSDNSTITIKGGTYNVEPTNYVDEDYEAKGNTESSPTSWTVSIKPLVLVTLNGTTTSYDKFSDAWTYATANSGSVIKLNRSVIPYGSVCKLATTNSVILDLNGKTFNNTSTSETVTRYTFNIASGTFTIRDSSSSGTGRIQGNTGFGSKNGSVLYASGGSIILESGTIIERNSTGDTPSTSTIYAVNSGASVTISGGTVIGTVGKANKSGTVTVTGGWFSNQVTSSYVTTSGYYATGKCINVPNSSAPYTVRNTSNFTVKFDVKEGTAIADVTAEANKAYKLPTTTKDGKLFNYWTIGDSSKPTYEAGTEVWLGDNITFTANWTDPVASLTVEGNTQYFKSVKDAYDALPTSGTDTATIQLQDDDNTIAINLENKIPVVFDLNGHTLTLSSTETKATKSRVFNALADLTIEDTSASNSGSVIASSNEEHYIARIAAGVVLTVKGGSYISGKTNYNFMRVSGSSGVNSGLANLDTSKISWFNNKLSSFDTVNGESLPEDKTMSSYAAQVSTDQGTTYKYTYSNTFVNITYDANKGISDAGYMPESQSAPFVNGYTNYYNLRIQQPIRAADGDNRYVFSNWNTVQDPTTDNPGTVYEAGATISFTTDDDIKLYAQWSEYTGSELPAKIGDTAYQSVMHALYAAAENDEIVLQQDVTETITVVTGKKVTIDFNGMTLTGNGTGSAITNNGDLTITGDGTITGTAQSYGGGIENKGTLTLESGTITGSAPKGGDAVYVNGGTFYMNGGTVISSGAEENSGISIYITNNENSKLYISGALAKVGGTIQKGANGTVEISQGQFKEDPSAFVAEWSERKEVTGDYPYSVSYKQYSISITSRIKGTNGTIAYLTGGGSCIYAGTVEITAYEIPGFTFLGWYSGYTTSNIGTELPNTYSEQEGTYTATCSKPTSNMLYYAVYEPVPASTFSLSVNARGSFTVKVNGSEVSEYDTIDAGATVTVEYTDESYTFAGWSLIPLRAPSEGGKILTDSKSYTFVMHSDTNLTAVDDSSEENTAMVIFKSYYGQIIESETADTTYGYGTFPAGPARLGYQFTKWVFSDDKTTEATNENIINKISTSGGLIYIEPEYSSIEESYKVTVNYVDDSADPQVLSESVSVNIVNGSAELTAPVEISDKNFLYWRDELGYKLSYKNSYTVRACNNYPIYAVYGNSETASDVCINITNLVCNSSNTKQHIACTETFSLPDGYSLVSTGFVYFPLLDRNENEPDYLPSCSELNNALVLGSENVYGFRVYNEVSALKDVKDGTFILNLYAPPTYYVNVYARAYVQYTKPGDSTVYIQYSDIFRSKDESPS